MATFWLVTIPVFSIVTFTFWWLTVDAYQREYSPKMRNVWGTRVYYWQFVIYISTGITFLILLLLRYLNLF